ncbi:MAG: 30S ribosomal protein S6 [Chloroflexi bacterium]|nr:30S ribosomal protein S6 [Chloroflexota bacterium]
MRDYELVFIISPEVDDDKISATVERVTQFITQRGGVVAQIDHWGKRKFAYPIGHFKEGNYVLAQFKSEPGMAKELEDSLRIAEDILRHLLVRSEGQKKKAVPVETPSYGQGDGGSAENGGIEQDNDNR